MTAVGLTTVTGETSPPCCHYAQSKRLLPLLRAPTPVLGLHTESFPYVLIAGHPRSRATAACSAERGLGLGDLIDRIYEAAAIPERWTSVLEDVTRLAGARASVLIAARGAAFNRWVVSSPDFAEIVLAHAERYPMNERTRRLVTSQHAGFLRDCDVFTPDEVEAEPIYREFLIPKGYGSGIATTIQVPSGDTFIIHAEREHRHGPIALDVVRRLDALRPHFARAALLSAQLDMERIESTARILEVVGLPAGVLGKRGRLLAANTPLETLMPGVFQDRQTRLALADAGADALLSDAVTQIETERRPVVRSIPIRARDGHPPIIAHLIPVRGAAHDIFARAEALLVATAVVPKDVPTANVVQGLFDLTPAEAKLATLIASGQQLRDASLQLGVTEHTARTTLKRVLAKTATHRQTELAGLLQGISLAN